jgi:gluconolactonase
VRRLADGLAFPEGPVIGSDGSVTVSEMAAGRIVRVRPGGDRGTVADVGGGPNGLAVLDDGRLVVCQSGGSTWGRGPWPRPGPGSVDIFRPVGPADQPSVPAVIAVEGSGRLRTLATTFVTASGKELALSRPSDVAPDGSGGFWMTDLGATSGRTRHLTGLLHGTPEGTLTEVVHPLEMPNGVAVAPDFRTVYVSETRTRRVWAFEVAAPGRIGAASALATVPAGGPMRYGGADGICVDPEGRIVVATLGTGGVTAFAPDGSLLGALVLEDPLTTNAAVSADGRWLVVTLGSTGRLVAIDDWVEQLSGVATP